MLKTLKEAFNKYKKDFIKSRMKKSWKENLFFLPLFAALVVGFMMLIQHFVPPEWL